MKKRPAHPLKYIPTAAVLLAGTAAVLSLAWFDPMAEAAPKCVFKTLTGYDCPGCGSQRAIHALLQGNFAAAWHFNAAIFFAAPLCIALATNLKPIRRLKRSPAFYVILALLIIIWWVGRNI